MTSRHLIFALLAAGLLAGCDRTNLPDLGNTTIANGAIKVRHGEVTLHVDDAPDATISAEGHLNIDGKPVVTTPPQDELLKRYQTAAAAVREHGIATGKAGAAVAGEAIKGVAASIANGDGDQVDKRVNAQTKRVEQAAMKICEDIADIKTAQDSLAAELPAFKPYGHILGPDAANDCRKDD